MVGPSITWDQGEADMAVRVVNFVFLVLFTAGLSGSATAYTKHVRYYIPDKEGEANAQKLSFILETSLGNPDEPKQFFVQKVQLSATVDPITNQIDPKLLTGEDSVELSFVANDIYWSVEPESCTSRQDLRN